MKRLILPVVALGLLNICEYASVVQWGVIEPWQQAWRWNDEKFDPNAFLLCATSIVMLATVAMALAVTYPTLRTNFKPPVARVKVLIASALALPSLLVLLWLPLMLVPEFFFVALFPLVPIGVALPFLWALTARMPNGRAQRASQGVAGATGVVERNSARL
jgi:hypothetical protein